MSADMRRREYSTQAREGPPLPSIAAVLADAAPGDPDGHRALRAPLELQSWPGIVHGGAVLGLFDAAAESSGSRPARRGGPADVVGSRRHRARARAPRGRRHGATRRARRADNRSRAARSAGSARKRRSRGRRGRVAKAGGSCRPPSGVWRAARRTRSASTRRSAPTQTAYGLASTLRRRGRAPTAAVHPALAPVILDELAWWLGALVMKEGGVTNRIRVALLEPGGAWEAPARRRGPLRRGRAGRPAPRLLEDRDRADVSRTGRCSRPARSSIAGAPSTRRASSRTSARERPARSSRACSRTTAERPLRRERVGVEALTLPSPRGEGWAQPGIEARARAALASRALATAIGTAGTPRLPARTAGPWKSDPPVATRS